MKFVTPLIALLGSILILTACSTPSDSSDTAGPTLDFQPNIVWIVAEDMSANIPAFGDSTIETPNLSRLAAEGVRYTHLFSPSGVCAPSRAALATGMYQNHIGAHHMRTGPWYASNIPDSVVHLYRQYMPDDVYAYEAMPEMPVKMHGEYMRMAGYYATNNNKMDYQFRAPLTAWDESSNAAHWKNRQPGQPFFAIFNLGVTHESQIWGRMNDSLWVDEDLDVPVPPYLPDNEIGRQDVRRMYSNIKIMDYQVGELLAELDEAGLMDSTIVMWYTDHGGPLPRQKRLLYDSGMHVPMIIRFPGQWHAGEIDDQLISFIDFKPTIMSLIGVEPPHYVDGQAFLGEFAEAPREYVHGAGDRFDEEYDMVRATRDHRYKYLRNYQPDKPYYLPVAYREQMPVMKELLRLHEAGELDEYEAQWFRQTKDPEELFDTVNDPHELHNLAGDPAYSHKLTELSAEMDRWMEEINDKGLMPEHEYIASIWPEGQQPVTAVPELVIGNGMMSLESATEGASIGYQYTSDEGDLDPRWEVYDGSILMKEGMQVVAFAHRLGFKSSEPVVLDY